MNEMPQAVNRLTELVRTKLCNAALQEWRLVEDYPGEQAYIVLWRNERECGVHRAVLARVPRDGEVNAMLVWGHYFPYPVQARLDFNERTRNVDT